MDVNIRRCLMERRLKTGVYESGPHFIEENISTLLTYNLQRNLEVYHVIVHETDPIIMESGHLKKRTLDFSKR
jgi:hypothetical protein